MRTNRRKFFAKAGVSAAALSLATTRGAAAPAQPRAKAATRDADAPILQVGDNIAVAETTSGKVRGYILRDIHYFLGVPYGADTSGPNRFMPPQKPKPWTDIRPALWWGNTAPQNMDNRYANQYASFRDHWNYDDVSEDCLRLNVFTPALKDGKKRPVMFWIHGGGYSNGNAIEQDGYNGENLARSGDVVFVSINHRLGPLGYCNLAGAGGEKYAASGNVGQLDLVAALEWVRDNIANFGGDPANVTIMGQSGGGAKVCVLSAMPSAKGLFHRAVVLDRVAVGVAAAVDPEHHRPLLAVLQCRREHVEPQAVFADVVVVPVVAERPVLAAVAVVHVLRRGVAPPQRRADVGPGLGLLRRHETVGAGRVGAVRHAEEIVDVAEDVAADLAVARVGDRDVVADLEDRTVLVDARGPGRGRGRCRRRALRRRQGERGRACARLCKELAPIGPHGHVSLNGRTTGRRPGRGSAG